MKNLFFSYGHIQTDIETVQTVRFHENAVTLVFSSSFYLFFRLVQKVSFFVSFETQFLKLIHYCSIDFIQKHTVGTLKKSEN